MKNIKTIILSLFVALFVFSCSEDGDEWQPPINNDPTGNFEYESSTEYFQWNGRQKPDSAIASAGKIRVSFLLNSADMYITPQIGWNYSVHLSNFENHTLSDSSVVTSFAINTQEVEYNDVYYRVLGTSNKAIRNIDGSLVGYYDGYISNDSLIFEFQSDTDSDGWSVADFRARPRN